MSTDATDVADAADAAGVEASRIRTRTAEGVVAELELDHDRLPLRQTLRRAPGVTVEPEYRARLDSGRTVLFVSVRGGSVEAFQSAIRTDPTVANPELTDRTADRAVYRLELTEEAITVCGWVATVGGRVLEMSASAGGWLVQLRLPDRDSLVAFNDRCKRHDLSVQVTHLRTAADDGQVLLGLTAKQQELLTVAYEEGYFDVPRGISQDELADRLGVSKSAISQRLRRATAELCEASLAK